MMALGIEGLLDGNLVASVGNGSQKQDSSHLRLTMSPIQVIVVRSSCLGLFMCDGGNACIDFPSLFTPLHCFLV